MRIKLIIDLEIAEGSRSGTRYGWTERVARCVGAFAGRMRPVERLHHVEVHLHSADELPETVLMSFDGEEIWPTDIPVAFLA